MTFVKRRIGLRDRARSSQLGWTFPLGIVATLVAIGLSPLTGNVPVISAPSATAATNPSCITTPTDFANAFLNAIPEPDTADNVEAIIGWEEREGGNWHNAAMFNPLNTTRVYDGSTSINSVGVESYSSWDDGVTATVQTITNGFYSGILAAFAAGNDPVAVANAVGASPWGTPNFASLLPPTYDPPSPSWQPVCGTTVWQANQTIPDGTLFVQQGELQQYVSARGASLPVSVGDAEAFAGEGVTGLAQAADGYVQAHPSSALPANTVVRVVGTPSQYLFNGNQLQPIEAPAISSCLVFTYGQPAVVTVPTMWSDTITVGPGVGCSLPNSTRFTEQGSLQQYISYAGGSLPISYGDAEAYDSAKNSTVATMAPGYVSTHPAELPRDSIVLIVGTPSQYLYDGSVLRPIGAPGTSACLLYTYGQASPYVVPTMWSDTIPIGQGISCTLPNATRFTDQGSLQQYISWYGASLPMSYGDAMAYDAEGDKTGATMPAGYSLSFPASALPANTIVRVVGTPTQYLFDGSSLLPISSPSSSNCLLQEYGQATPAVVPTMWSDTILVGQGISCSNPPAGGGGGGGTNPIPTPTAPPATAVGNGNQPLSGAATAIATTSVGGQQGYWVASSTGDVDAFGSAVSYGNLTGTTLNAPIIAMVATADGQGYYLLGADGGIFSFGDAKFYGSTGGIHLNQPVVGMAVTPDGGGYWLVAKDGGVFSFGDADFHGSTGSLTLNKPVVGMTVDPATGGYWLVASDGGVFAFDAPFEGSTGNLTLNKPIVGITTDASGLGYRMVASDGGIFSFGDAPFFGSLGATPPAAPIEAMAPTTDGGGYYMLDSSGNVYPFGDGVGLGDG
jgi:hypothetical protein